LPNFLALRAEAAVKGYVTNPYWADPIGEGYLVSIRSIYL